MSETKPRGWRRLLGVLGPGVTAGAADDDPSGIATFTVTGAQFGTALLWSALFTWPLMAGVQMVCARVGMVTGRGLAAALRQRFPRWLVGLMSLLLLLANIINIAADLSGMADATQLLGGGSSHVWVWVYGLGICALAIRLRYQQLAKVLQWLALALGAYIVTALLSKPDWGKVLHDTFLPHVPQGAAGWSAVVAILGTTISPFLFFWQAGQEVEEEKAKGHVRLWQRQGTTPRALADRRLDVGIGTFVSNLVMFFIILTAASTLHRHGITQVDSTKAAAEALRPFAGDYAYLLFSLGVIGTGLLAIPTLAGSAAYAFAETFEWRYGLDRKFSTAVPFYAVFIAATVGGALLDLLHIDPIKALVWSAVVNGILAPFLLIALLVVASDKRVMLDQPAPLLGRITVGVTALLMFGAIIAMWAL